MRKTLLTLIVLTLPVALAGCAILANLGNAIHGQPVDPVYKLADRPTLILIDDSDRKLGDPSVAALVAATVAQHLQEVKAVGNFVDPSGVSGLVVKYGKDFDRMPIDQVGQELGAQQVIDVHVDSTAVFVGPDLARPTATVQVRVIDVTNHRRIFPVDEGGLPSGDRGYTLPVSMEHKALSDPRQGMDNQLQRLLAQRIGRDVARLFTGYDASKPDMD